jgi:serine protease Do
MRTAVCVFAKEGSGGGSGVVISPDGYALTNFHVVQPTGPTMQCGLPDGVLYDAVLVGLDKVGDVALIKLLPKNEGQQFPFAVLGDSDKTREGDWSIAMGNPFLLATDFTPTVTFGLVSGVHRYQYPEGTLLEYTDCIQIDTSINPGNSGGPLFNLNGEVVGINSMIFSRTGGFMGLSFAIPIDVAIDVAKQLQATGRVSRGRIGVVIQEVTKELAESFGLSKPSGALVNSVEKGSPADKAGIQPSDVILKFDNKEVTASNELPRIVAATKPGSKVSLQVWRKGEKKDLQITVAETPDERVAKRQPPGKKTSGETLTKLGLSVTELTSDQKNELSIANGVLVENAEGAAAKAGIRRGDVIQAVNNQEVKSIEELNRLLSPVDRSRTVAVLIKRGEGSVYIPLKLATN